MPARYVRFRVPRIPPGLGANLLGLAGLIGFAVTVGALAGNWWWSAGVGSVIAVGLSWIASADEPATAAAEPSNVHPILAAPAPAGVRSA